MTNSDWKKRLGMVYSTNPKFNFEYDRKEEEVTPHLPLKPSISSSTKKEKRKDGDPGHRFQGTSGDLEELGKN